MNGIRKVIVFKKFIFQKHFEANGKIYEVEYEQINDSLSLERCFVLIVVWLLASRTKDNDVVNSN